MNRFISAMIILYLPMPSVSLRKLKDNIITALLPFANSDMILYFG